MSTSTKAIGDLIGALCYAMLRVFQIAGAGSAFAPSMELADRQAAFAAEEYERYRILRERLVALSEDTDAAVQTFRGAIDAFYEGARANNWLEVQVFHFVGNSITTDFAEILATRVDDETGFAVRRALTGRNEQEEFALGQITAAVEEGTATQDDIAHLTGQMVGHGLSRLREALMESDALEQVLGGDEVVKDVVLEMLGRHRERLVRLGLDTID